MMRMSASAKLVLAAAEQLARRNHGYAEVHELLVEWSELPLADSAIARALRNPDIWRGRTEVLRERELVAHEMIERRHTVAHDPFALLTLAHQRAAEAGAETILESHLLGALADMADVSSVGLDVARALEEVRRSEVRRAEVRHADALYVAGEDYDALRRFLEYVRSATSMLLLVDNYIDTKVLDLFTEKRPDVEVRILTRDVTPALRHAAAAFASKYGPMQVRLQNVFHDRFLVIDDAEIVHLGASVKDMGKKTFRMSPVEDLAEAQRLRTHVADVWAASAAGM